MKITHTKREIHCLTCEMEGQQLHILRNVLHDASEHIVLSAEEHEVVNTVIGAISMNINGKKEKKDVEKMDIANIPPLGHKGIVLGGHMHHGRLDRVDGMGPTNLGIPPYDPVVDDAATNVASESLRRAVAALKSDKSPSCRCSHPASMDPDIRELSGRRLGEFTLPAQD